MKPFPKMISRTEETELDHQFRGETVTVMKAEMNQCRMAEDHFQTVAVVLGPRTRRMWAEKIMIMMSLRAYTA